MLVDELQTFARPCKDGKLTEATLSACVDLFERHNIPVPGDKEAADGLWAQKPGHNGELPEHTAAGALKAQPQLWAARFPAGWRLNIGNYLLA
jgi:hypothetical protein